MEVYRSVFIDRDVETQVRLWRCRNVVYLQSQEQLEEVTQMADCRSY
uniref:Uncharacterized protein n=1 Tax=Anguilla anguilla TaxID=7936 RepID=A0A0E9RJG4_ANGAN